MAELAYLYCFTYMSSVVFCLLVSVLVIFASNFQVYCQLHHLTFCTCFRMLGRGLMQKHCFHTLGYRTQGVFCSHLSVIVEQFGRYFSFEFYLLSMIVNSYVNIELITVTSISNSKSSFTS